MSIKAVITAVITVGSAVITAVTVITVITVVLLLTFITVSQTAVLLQCTVHESCLYLYSLL